MIRLAVISICFVSLVSPAAGEIITVPFSAIVTEVVGVPFGIVAQVGITRVTGSFAYDTATEPFGNGSTNAADFLATIPSGFILNVGGVTISSSDYLVQAHNAIPNSGSPDIFSAGAHSDSPNSMGDDFRVNGLPAKGFAGMTLTDRDQTLYPTNASVKVLPTQAQLDQVDYQLGFLADAMGAGGQSANRLSYAAAPEPFAALLFAQGVLASASIRLRRRVTIKRLNQPEHYSNERRDE